ncbi:MAG: class I SAM-dependent methyltransferase [Sphingomonadaceae bacterium]|nr:class I SAM-dependent methyltransferase [Sphingomonadaceae bacterium]
MRFSDPAVAAVHADYERRRTEEMARQAAMGGAMLARRDEFLLPVGPEVGAFLHSLILARRPARILELGTSYGYSTLFLADAARQVGGILITMDLADYKQAEARTQIERAGLGGVVDFRLGDAVALIDADPGPFDFVLLDIWKDLYVLCLEAFHPKLSDEAIVAADNMIEPDIARPDARAYRAAVRALSDMQSALLPIGSGIELSVKWRAASSKL